VDIESLLRSLNDHSVEYVLIGATAFPDRPEAAPPRCHPPEGRRLSKLQKPRGETISMPR
jgi:hypothetical protein